MNERDESKNNVILNQESSIILRSKIKAIWECSQRVPIILIICVHDFIWVIFGLLCKLNRFLDGYKIQYSNRPKYLIRRRAFKMKMRLYLVLSCLKLNTL